MATKTPTKAPTEKQLVAVLLDRHGRTYAREAGIGLERGTPAPLWQLLCLSILLSARISASLSVRAAQALRRERWTTARKLRDSSWERRAKVLNEAGYARFDERTATMLGDAAQLALDEYDGDLRRLREAADHDPGAERKLLKRFKGIGDVGADIFLREVQAVWVEVRPFIDDRALDAAGRLGLKRDAKRLASLVAEQDLARLAAALVRAGLAGDFDELRAAAA